MLGCSAFFAYNSGMDFVAELAPFDLPPELVWRLQQWAEQAREEAAGAHRQAADVARLEAELKASKLKIEALSTRSPPSGACASARAVRRCRRT
jgi:hypothetical protein